MRAARRAASRCTAVQRAAARAKRATLPQGADGRARRAQPAAGSAASHDRALRHRTALEVKQRGRWTSDGSMRRYEAHARLQQEELKLPAAHVSAVVASHANADGTIDVHVNTS